MKRIFFSALGLVCILLLIGAASVNAAVWYVSPYGNGTNDGLSWATAKDFQSAIDAAASIGDVIKAHQGTYPSKTYTVNKAVMIYGGYSGTGDERDPQSYPSVIHGYNYYQCFVVQADATIDGFTITSGKANYGGGMNISNVAATISNCKFTFNNANSIGGAIFIHGYAIPTIVNCSFEDNRTWESSSTFGIGGGAIYIYFSDAIIKECVFSRNWSKFGGAVYNYASSPSISNSVFLENQGISGGNGGAILNRAGYSMIYPTSIKNGIKSCIFGGNLAGKGGAIYSYQGGYPPIINCTFSKNSNYAVYSDPSLAIIRNSILWGNTPGQIIGAANVEYSDIQGGYSGTGNINRDPLFVAPLSNDFHISDPLSPCINKGTDAPTYNHGGTLIPFPIGSTDFEGDDRIIGGLPDIGADEALSGSGGGGVIPGTADLDYDIDDSGGGSGNIEVTPDDDPSDGSVGARVGAEVFAYGGTDPVTQSVTAYADGTLPFTVDQERTLYLNVSIAGVLGAGGPGSNQSKLDVKVFIKEYDENGIYLGTVQSYIKVESVSDNFSQVGPINETLPYTAYPDKEYELEFHQTLYATASFSGTSASADFMGTSLFSVGTNVRPIADAGADQATGSPTITLDGTGSSDPDNNLPLSYQWSVVDKPVGSAPTFSDTGVAEPTVTLDLQGTYIFELEVTDNFGLASLPDKVTIELTVADTDGDGVIDSEDNCMNDPNPDQADDDNDGAGNVCDLCPEDPDNDIDADGVCGDSDNCPLIPNSDQLNNDGDDWGDVCDADDDNDGIADVDDNCPMDPNPDQADYDGDGAGDVCDNDTDGDGVLGSVDLCPHTPAGKVVDEDGCSIPDYCGCDNDWKNHGSYVSCVAHKSEEFVEAELITEAEKDVIVSEAAQSECGFKDK